MERYAIHEANMGRLKQKMLRCKNKCDKYGIHFEYNEVGEEYRKVTGEGDEEHTARFVLIEVEGHAVINGWRFAATLDHTSEGNIIKAYDESVEIPKRYYDADPICEHCKTTRTRNHTFIVKNEGNGHYKQVGKSCLRDYTGGMDADAIAAFMSVFDLEDYDTPMGGSHSTRYYETAEMLAYMAESVRIWGYVKSGFGNYGTASRATDYYRAEHGGQFFRGERERLLGEIKASGFDPTSDRAVKLAEDARAWAMALTDNSNNYLHNLRVICALDYVTPDNFNLLASVFPSYDREIEHQAAKAERERAAKEEAAKAAKSVHVGKIGERITVSVEDLRCVTSFGTDYGMLYIYRIVGTDGNVYIWKTGVLLGDGITAITGTIKEHTEYRGVAQTVLTRCKTKGADK